MQNKTGTKEWAETTINIARGCEHGCRYCYARQIMVDRFHKLTAEEWKTTTVNQEVVDANYGKKQGVIMIPSAHDIVPSIINEFCIVLRKLLDVGNEVLIVSKPHWQCITMICDFFKEHRDKILFRFTIGSTNSDVLEFWEPGAPNFQERLACLQYAFDLGYKTSVSCEPYLDVYPSFTYAACSPYITDSFWIGKLRHFNSRVRLDDATPEQIKKFVEPLKLMCQDKVIRGIHKMLDGHKFIQWKDSIREVVEK